MLLPTLCLLPLSFHPCQESETGPPAAQAQAEEAPTELEITFLANSGFLLRAGNVKVLIDAFLKEPYNVYEALPPGTYRKLVEGEAPFDGNVLALVSHMHRDHFQARPAELFLQNNPKAGFIASPQVVVQLKKKAQDWESIKGLVGRMPVDFGQIQGFSPPNMKVEFIRLRHGGGDQNLDVENYGHILTMAGFKVLHVGDADASLEAFAAYDFKAMDIDIAFVPFWYFATEEGIAIIDDVIHADWVIACHMPLREKRKLLNQMGEENPQILIFEEPGDVKVFRQTDETVATDGD